LNYKYFVWITSLFIVLLFHTHYPIAAVFLLAFGIHALILSYSMCEKKLSVFIREFFKLTAPLFISLLFIIPSLVYFKTFAIVNSVSLQSAFSSDAYFHNISLAWSFFAKFEFLYLAIFLKIFLLLFLYFRKITRAKENKIVLSTSNFLSLFFCIYILVIARTVLLFERYVIVLQPVLVCIILLDILLCFRAFQESFDLESANQKKTTRTFVIIILIAIWINLVPQMDSIKGHLYELTHQYKGPLDYVIPYIEEKFSDPSKIIIATNYEENSYMYYLNSKTIVGYVGNNLAEDRKLEPDIIIFRKFFNFDQAYVNVFNDFLNKQKYEKVSFPIFDYPFNNIPELNYTVPHLYQTKFADNDDEKLDIYLKQ
jgi:hypothetical protein